MRPLIELTIGKKQGSYKWRTKQNLFNYREWRFEFL